jgi:hypothetical protein
LLRAVEQIPDFMPAVLRFRDFHRLYRSAPYLRQLSAVEAEFPEPEVQQCVKAALDEFQSNRK